MNRATIRQWHSYIGVFVAPSVLFFALTGAVQLFSLHEAHGHYKPPAIIEKLSSVHKDQVFKLGHHHDSEAGDADAGKSDAAPAKAVAEAPKAGAPPGAAKEHDDDDEDALTTTLLKWFFLVVAVCLIFSTAFGVWMGVTQTRRKSLAWGLLVAGAVIPWVLSAA